MMKIFKAFFVTTAICGLLAATPVRAASESSTTATAGTIVTKTRLTVKDVTEIQKLLTEKGFYKSKVDGQFGPGTQDAVRDFQTSLGVEANGYPTADTLAKLGVTPENPPVTGDAEPAGKGGVVYTETISKTDVTEHTHGAGIGSVESTSQNGGNCLTCSNGPMGNGGTKSMHSNAF